MTTENYQDISLNYDNNVATITINRPETLNSIRMQTYEELIHAFTVADNSSLCNVIVLTGAGEHFSSGNDLSDLIGTDHKELMKYVGDIFKTVATLKKVLIAVVDGVAVGIGTTILLHCDLVVSSSRARFRLPFTTLGVSPEGGASSILPIIIGQKHAREVLLTGRFFTADEAKSWGLVNAVSEPDKLSEVLESYLSQLIKQPLESLVATKSLMRASLPDIPQLIDTELHIFTELLGAESTQKRIQSFLKR
ncbi:enoyl-CoA hydratase/isomerase family protein [Desulforhopalus sp. 52FAK]